MDLPTTDPGSDFYDFNSAESADEEPRKQPVFPAENPCARLDGQFARSPAREAEEMEKPADCLILPEIVRPRSVSFGENLILCSEQRKTTKRSHCRRLARPLRNPSPVSLKSQDIQIKLSSLRRQIWTGVPLAEGNEARMEGFGRRPLSWGVSKFALAQCGADTLLRSCSRKLESLGKPKTRVSRSSPDPSPASRPEKQPHPGKPSRKKTSRLKWQRAVNLSSRIKETCAAKSSFLTIKADSLKLVAAPSPKRVPRPRKLDAGRKYRGSESVEKFRKPASQAPMKPGKPGKRGARGELEQTRYRMRFACSSSEDESAGSGKRKGGKKKQRKKKQQRKAKTPPAQGRKKRAFSGKEMRNNIHKE